jgi:hypothetical protein
LVFREVKELIRLAEQELVPGRTGRKNEGWPRKEALGYEQEWEN